MELLFAFFGYFQASELNYFKYFYRVKTRSAALFCFLIFQSTVLLGCTAEESDTQAQISYDRNVESCICRMLAFEADSYSGIEYGDMIRECNTTVQNANPTRYSMEFHTEIDPNALRCPEDLEDWQEAIEEAKTHQQASRDRYEEFTEPTNNSESD